MSYYQEGYDACQSGFAKSDCPYPRGTAGFSLWMAGFSAATIFKLELALV